MTMSKFSNHTSNSLIPLLVILALVAAGVYYAIADLVGIDTTYLG